MVKSLQKRGKTYEAKVYTCSMSKARMCDDNSEEDRESMFDPFWTKLEWNRRKTNIASLVYHKPTERWKKCRHSRRQGTLQYHLRIRDGRVQVCKTLLMNAYVLKNGPV